MLGTNTQEQLTNFFSIDASYVSNFNKVNELEVNCPGANPIKLLMAVIYEFS